MTSEFIRRYIIMRIIQNPESYNLSRPYVALEELQLTLNTLRSKNIDDGLYEKLEFNSHKTINRDIKSIASYFGVHIKHKRNRGFYEDEESFNPNDELKEIYEKTELYLLHHHAHSWKKYVTSSRTSLSPYVNMVALINAIEHNYLVQINYKGWYDDNGFQNINKNIQPLHIKEINNAWYLIGYNTEIGIYAFCLDNRIRGLTITNKLCKDPITFNEGDYFHNSIGILKGDLEIEWIHIKVANHHFKYLENNPLHHSQVVVSYPKALNTEHLDYNNDAIWGEIKIHLEPNYEFFMQILKYNRWVKIVSPGHVVKEMKEHINCMSMYYK